MTSKQTSDSKNHNPEGHNQHTDNKSSATGGHQGSSSSGSGNSGGKSGCSSASGNAKSPSRSPAGSTQGGTHEQHVKAGQQSHKNS